jgi:hypothetical protein
MMTPPPAPQATVPDGVVGTDIQTDSWYHTAGRYCFKRTIDPQRYPPISKQKVPIQ